MKKYVIIIVLSFLFWGCLAQNDKPKALIRTMNLSFINNRIIKHAIVLLSCDTCVPIRNIGLRVRVVLSKKNEIKVRQITADTWIKLLYGGDTDWVANLILYNLYNKEAYLLSKNDSRNLWINYLKKEDMAFWTKSLINNH